MLVASTGGSLHGKGISSLKCHQRRLLQQQQPFLLRFPHPSFQYDGDVLASRSLKFLSVKCRTGSRAERRD
jgi:hypothetical protein